MPQNEQDNADPPLISYLLLRRDTSGEQMNECHFFEPSDEVAIKIAEEFLGIPELSEEHFKDIGYFELSRKGGPRIFPALPPAT